MDCGGCNDSGEDEVLRELNPDALAKGWAPAMRGDLGDCGCAGACNRSGGDAGEAYDFPEDLSHFWVRPLRRRDRPVRGPGSGAKRDLPDKKKDKDNLPDDSETDKLPPDAPVYVDDGIEVVEVHAGALPDINYLLWSLSDVSDAIGNPGPSGGSRGGGGVDTEADDDDKDGWRANHPDLGKKCVKERSKCEQWGDSCFCEEDCRSRSHLGGRRRGRDRCRGRRDVAGR
jgi:hypothetical protein